MEEMANEYYRIQYTRIIEDANHSWRGKARIFRKDSGEQVAQVATKYAQNIQDVKEQLEVKVQKQLESLSQPPEDWGQDGTIPALIQRYLNIRDKTYGLFVEAENASSEARTQALRHKSDAFEAREFQGLQQDIAKLSETQKIALIAPTGQQRIHRTDPRVLDILMAKKGLYRLIDNPSPEIHTSYYDLKALIGLGKIV